MEQQRERNSILCPNCRKLISADEPRCPYCGLLRPGGSAQRILSFRFIDGNRDWIRIILYVNVAFFLASLVLNPSVPGLGMNPFTFLSPSSTSLFLLGATGTIPIDQLHRWWTLISASYLHGGLLHIFFNMLAFLQLGPFVLREYGFHRFFLVYTWSGVLGFLVSWLAGIPFTIGASASICGLIGATLYYGKSRGGLYGNIVYRQVMGWTIGLILFGFMVPGINNWAHGGGLAGGILLGFLLGYADLRRESPLQRLLSGATVLLTAGILVYALAYAVFLRFFH
ncbi:MAG TPA: rhomboid family intramembrane serine protease [Syntrophales bacterium]|nr:rhomboid family intramembrane serine protease [Syntrophales bacterium]HPX10936.1 rhomboid family intramembrane serine protease [Syntrophales bacterium]HQN78166.1 rhomboid family intramembrane serine protease [Syntrophales bacterium]HQQ27715.1 rhomboid family intramembrane serine protease [Syntrophales bacterium]